MQMHLTKQNLARYVKHQIDTLFPNLDEIGGGMSQNLDILRYLDDTISRVEFCFKHIHAPYFNFNNKLSFNHLNSDHYAMFLYILSNTIYKIDKNENLASRIFLLNKALHGLDAFYSVDLPEIFIFVHPVGSVLGKAKYSNYFALYQNCTVGSTGAGEYATFMGECVMFSKSSVIGRCNIGKNVVFGANSNIINLNIKENSVVLGNYPDNKIIVNQKSVIDRIFR